MFGIMDFAEKYQYPGSINSNKDEIIAFRFPKSSFVRKKKNKTPIIEKIGVKYIIINLPKIFAIVPYIILIPINPIGIMEELEAFTLLGMASSAYDKYSMGFLKLELSAKLDEK